MHYEQLPQALRNILVVDDDSDIRSLTRTFLEHEGYNVFSCENADRAIHIFRRSPIDLLITDYSMPNRTGMDLAREAKALRPSLPVLIVSGAILDPVQLEQMRIRNWNFLPKPFSLPQLLGEVHRILDPRYARGSATLTA
ncbi:MAG: response regulator [Edaphobacter sp.]|uniref:response regulator n=1 Tax=Edaphobacter sp. TaxID=1934404 RepID=UPI002397EBF2|nr:response regulator [Edaphobacter sp.]MDE1178351.1 response regulator [Edaphobacter sp.]